MIKKMVSMRMPSFFIMFFGGCFAAVQCSPKILLSHCLVAKICFYDSKPAKVYLSLFEYVTKR